MFDQVKLCHSNFRSHPLCGLCCVMRVDDALLTVQVALPDSLHVLGVNELVASLPDNVDRRQVHVVADPDGSNRDSVKCSASKNPPSSGVQIEHQCEAVQSQIIYQHVKPCSLSSSLFILSRSFSH